MEITRREDGQIMIGAHTVADLVRGHHLRPTSSFYLSPKRDYGEPPRGCGVGFALVSAFGGVDRAIEVKEATSFSLRHDIGESLHGACARHYGETAGLDGSIAIDFEAGWCGFTPREGCDRDVLAMGEEARDQARAAWRELEDSKDGA